MYLDLPGEDVESIAIQNDILDKYVYYDYSPQTRIFCGILDVGQHNYLLQIT